MTHENKQLLLKDLCARLPYYTELYSNVAGNNWAILTPVIVSNLMNADDDLVIKPYLRPMSSITEEEREYLKHHINDDFVDYCNEHYLDYRGLIPMGLALEAPTNMYKTV